MSSTLADTSFIQAHQRHNGVWEITAPSNIALIKYMGKIDDQINIPSNPSLSYTSPHWHTRLTLTPSDQDRWAPWDDQSLKLTEQQQARYLAHWLFLKQQLSIEGCFTLRSTNNFPAHCGLASSASSFAALSLGAAKVAGLSDHPWQPIAHLSRQGSGSSCRSFSGPWVLWDHPSIEALHTPFDQLLHHLILIDKSPKAMGSSQAHVQIKTSPHYAGRADRAKRRLDGLLNGMEHQDWDGCRSLIWDEFIDMHQLFESAKPSFSYFKPATSVVLDALQTHYQQHKDGPWVTMDAGANIHLLYRPDQSACIASLKDLCSLHQQRYLEPNYD